MLFARVVLGLHVEGPFDYIIPAELEKKAKTGERVWVNFCNRKMPGYIVGITRKSKIKKLKRIIELIDEFPVLDKGMLLVTRWLSEYYCCSWGEAIDAALPESIRKGKSVAGMPSLAIKNNTVSCPEALLLQDLDGARRWDVYLEAIKNTCLENKRSILICPDKLLALKAQQIIKERLGFSSEVLYRKIPKELDTWLKIKEGKANIVVGTLSAVFSPVSNLGLIIIDEENDPAYKQDQVPHYNAREVARKRCQIEKAKLILGSTRISLESFYAAGRNEIKYLTLGSQKQYPQIQIIDMKSEYNLKNKNKLLSKYLQDAVFSAINAKEKVLLFLNRKGFATSATCHNCGVSLRCPRCNINLVYYFAQNSLNCHYCNFKMEVPRICPACNAGYIKFSGTGTEKIESELSRLFPLARIKRIDSNVPQDLQNWDIFISTSSIVKQKDYNFDLVGVLSIDNSLNRIDFRSTEKTFYLLSSLLTMTAKKLIVQTALPNNYCFQSLIKNDQRIFYNQELNNRKQLSFPPFRHMAAVKFRGKVEDKVKKSSGLFFEKLKECDSPQGIKIISLIADSPAKLRGNFYWKILVSSPDARRMSGFLKNRLKDFSHSGIIVTVDVDPL